MRKSNISFFLSGKETLRRGMRRYCFPFAENIKEKNPVVFLTEIIFYNVVWRDFSQVSIIGSNKEISHSNIDKYFYHYLIGSKYHGANKILFVDVLH